jgi:hypothetical protein
MADGAAASTACCGMRFRTNEHGKSASSQAEHLVRSIAVTHFRFAARQLEQDVAVRIPMLDTVDTGEK